MIESECQKLQVKIKEAGDISSALSVCSLHCSCTEQLGEGDGYGNAESKNLVHGTASDTLLVKAGVQKTQTF